MNKKAVAVFIGVSVSIIGSRVINNELYKKIDKAVKELEEKNNKMNEQRAGFKKELEELKWQRKKNIKEVKDIIKERSEVNKNMREVNDMQQSVKETLEMVNGDLEELQRLRSENERLKSKLKLKNGNTDIE